MAVPQAGLPGEWPEGMFEAELRVEAFQNGSFVADLDLDACASSTARWFFYPDRHPELYGDWL